MSETNKPAAASPQAPKADAPQRRPDITSATAKEIPAAAKVFLVAPRVKPGEEPPAPNRVSAVDEVDAIVAWCAARGVRPEDRNVTVVVG